jgi:hypothetical protein
MAGSIRCIVGFLVCYGAVGGMDTGSAILPCMALALAGLVCMYSGVSAMNKGMK